MAGTTYDCFYKAAHRNARCSTDRKVLQVGDREVAFCLSHYLSVSLIEAVELGDLFGWTPEKDRVTMTVTDLIPLPEYAHLKRGR